MRSLGEFVRGEHLHVMRHAVLGEGQLHAAHQIEGREEPQPVSGLGAGQTQGDGEVGLADAGRALKDDVARGPGVFGQRAHPLLPECESAPVVWTQDKG